jgi:hypothetical protein
MPSEDQVRQVKRRHSLRLLGLPGISGVGIEKEEDGSYVLAVHLDGTCADAGKEVPDIIEGVRVKFVRSGPFSVFGGKE